MQAAVSLLDAWMVSSSHAMSMSPAMASALRLWKASVSPLDILKAASGVWTYSHRHPRALPDDERLTYQLGVAVLQLTPRDRVISTGKHPRYRRHTGVMKRELGIYLRRSLTVSSPI